MAVTPGAPRTEPTTGSRARLPILLFLFLGSGCAALIYELVWFHYLRLVVGSTSISIAALLVSFMGGMGLGERGPAEVGAAVVAPTARLLRPGTVDRRDRAHLARRAASD